jgi:hypothetical protein
MAHWFFLLLFVIINIIQTWLILKCKLLIRGGITVGLIELLEAPLIIYLLLKDGFIIFFVVVATEVIQWLFIAYFTTKG